MFYGSVILGGQVFKPSPWSLNTTFTFLCLQPKHIWTCSYVAQPPRSTARSYVSLKLPPQCHLQAWHIHNMIFTGFAWTNTFLDNNKKSWLHISSLTCIKRNGLLWPLSLWRLKCQWLTFCVSVWWLQELFFSKNHVAAVSQQVAQTVFYFKKSNRTFHVGKNRQSVFFFFQRCICDILRRVKFQLVTISTSTGTCTHSREARLYFLLCNYSKVSLRDLEASQTPAVMGSKIVSLAASPLPPVIIEILFPFAINIHTLCRRL